MKKILTFSLTILLNFVLFSCEKEDGNNNQTSNNFLFLKTGNAWTYKMTIDGKNALSDISYKIQSIDKNSYYTILFTTVSGISHTDYVWYASSDFFADESGSETDYWFPLFYKSNNVGKKWTSPVEDDELGKVTREIVSSIESVVVPAGTFTNLCESRVKK